MDAARHLDGGPMSTVPRDEGRVAGQKVARRLAFVNQHDASQTMHDATQLPIALIHATGKDLEVPRHDLQDLQRMIH